jgi:methylmalonyl-CoA/ethylmalonyl-CoA epimerase
VSEEPKVVGLAQVAIISRDLQRSMRHYVEVADIGPWAVFDFKAPEVTNMILRGRPAHFSARLALAWTQGLMWEIIEPGEGESIYSEFLASRGEGLHHVMVRHDAADFDGFLDSMARKGIPVLMSMTYRGTRFAYLDTEPLLNMILEVVERTPGAAVPINRPGSEPAYWYPAPPADPT